jgi:hypothetical protein
LSCLWSEIRYDGDEPAGVRRIQIKALLIEQGIAVRPVMRALRKSLFQILKNRSDEISSRMSDGSSAVCVDWQWLDERIETVSREIEEISQNEAKCSRRRSAHFDGGGGGDRHRRDAFDCSRDFGAWFGLVLRCLMPGFDGALLRVRLPQHGRAHEPIDTPDTYQRLPLHASFEKRSQSIH